MVHFDQHAGSCVCDGCVSWEVFLQCFSQGFWGQMAACHPVVESIVSVTVIDLSQVFQANQVRKELLELDSSAEISLKPDEVVEVQALNPIVLFDAVHTKGLFKGLFKGLLSGLHKGWFKVD